jgi:predicted O-methyltransferase YrrM
MYSSFQLARKYFSFYLSAKNGKGHGVHSPFVFDFIIHILNDKKQYDCYPLIESLRRKLLRDPTVIEVEDFGAGSAVIQSKARRVKDIAASSLKKKKYARLLFRICRYYQIRNVIELGTSFGITTCYLASAHPDSRVITMEGSPAIAGIARNTFRNAGLQGIELIEGDFAQMLPRAMEGSGKAGMVFIDGNHRKEATLEYFRIFLEKSDTGSVFIFDDIHWSEGMEEAWKEIREHDAVTMTIDLFFIGLVFFSRDFKVRQHFSIRF